jgi:hypothetical protein
MTVGTLWSRAEWYTTQQSLSAADILKPEGSVTRTGTWSLGLLALEYTIRGDSSATPPSQYRPRRVSNGVPELHAVRLRTAPRRSLPLLTVEFSPKVAGGNRANGIPDVPALEASSVPRR